MSVDTSDLKAYLQWTTQYMPVLLEKIDQSEKIAELEKHLSQAMTQLQALQLKLNAEGSQHIADVQALQSQIATMQDTNQQLQTQLNLDEQQLSDLTAMVPAIPKPLPVIPPATPADSNGEKSDASGVSSTPASEAVPPAETQAEATPPVPATTEEQPEAAAVEQDSVVAE